jgi:hypothetical protein
MIDKKCWDVNGDDVEIKSAVPNTLDSVFGR